MQNNLRNIKGHIQGHVGGSRHNKNEHIILYTSSVIGYSTKASKEPIMCQLHSRPLE